MLAGIVLPGWVVQLVLRCFGRLGRVLTWHMVKSGSARTLCVSTCKGALSRTARYLVFIILTFVLFFIFLSLTPTGLCQYYCWPITDRLQCHARWISIIDEIAHFCTKMQRYSSGDRSLMSGGRGKGRISTGSLADDVPGGLTTPAAYPTLGRNFIRSLDSSNFCWCFATAQIVT